MAAWLTEALGFVTGTVSTLLGSLTADTAIAFKNLVMTVDETGVITGINPLGGFIFMLLGIGFVTGIIGWISSLVRRLR